MRAADNRIYPVTCALTALNVIIFFAGVIIPGLGGRIYEAGILDSSALINDREWWRLITSMFLHANISHLVSNMIVLFFAGGDVEKKLGHLCFLLMYIVTGLCGGLLSVYSSIRQGQVHLSLGASGAVFGMLGTLAVLTFRDRKKLDKGALPRLFCGIALSLYSGRTTQGIDHTAHLGGFIAGIVFGIVFVLITGKELYRND